MHDFCCFFTKSLLFYQNLEKTLILGGIPKIPPFLRLAIFGLFSKPKNGNKKRRCLLPQKVPWQRNIGGDPVFLPWETAFFPVLMAYIDKMGSKMALFEFGAKKGPIFDVFWLFSIFLNFCNFFVFFRIFSDFFRFFHDFFTFFAKNS